MPREKLQVETLLKHPEPHQRDLNPNAMAGQNLGLSKAQAAKQGPTAYDVKPVHERLKRFSDDELKQLRILPPGNRLEQGDERIARGSVRGLLSCRVISGMERE
jgi:hypothetical protein